MMPMLPVCFEACLGCERMLKRYAHRRYCFACRVRLKMYSREQLNLFKLGKTGVPRITRARGNNYVRQSRARECARGGGWL